MYIGNKYSNINVIKEAHMVQHFSLIHKHKIHQNSFQQNNVHCQGHLKVNVIVQYVRVKVLS